MDGSVINVCVPAGIQKMTMKYDTMTHTTHTNTHASLWKNHSFSKWKVGHTFTQIYSNSSYHTHMHQLGLEKCQWNE